MIATYTQIPMRIRTYAHTRMCIHMYAHTDTQSKQAKPTAAITQLLPPSEPALGCLAPLRHLSLVRQILLGQG